MWWWALICTEHAGTVCTRLTGLNIVPIKYSSDIHTPKHNSDIINIADITVTVYDVTVTVYDVTVTVYDVPIFA